MSQTIDREYIISFDTFNTGHLQNMNYNIMIDYFLFYLFISIYFYYVYIWFIQFIICFYLIVCLFIQLNVYVSIYFI